MRKHRIQTDTIGKSLHYKSQVMESRRRDEGVRRRPGLGSGPEGQHGEK